MSNYTLQLREYIDSVSTASNTRDRIEDARTKLFDFDYPIFDPNYKGVFETHFMRNFYMREIGQETMGLFKFYLETWLQVNMPYFNKMFQSELIQFNPLQNTGVDTTHTNNKTKTHELTTGQTVNRDVTTTNDGTTTDDNFDRNLESNNPDTRLNLTANDGVGVIEYASRINENNENNKSTTHATTVTGDDTNATTNVGGTVTDFESYVFHKTGKIGVQSYSKMLEEYRKILLRIELQIFNEMNQLFMLVY